MMKAMRKPALAMLGVILLLLALAAVMVFASKKVQAAEEVWKNWGVAPYASSQEEACSKASEAIDGFLMLLPVKEHFKQALGDTCEGGEETLILPAGLLEQMWSVPDARHKKPFIMNRVAVEEIPVPRSASGRAYRDGSVVQAAKAYSWEFAYEGKTYVLYLPYVCFNWSWTFAPELLQSPTPVLAPAQAPAPAAAPKPAAPPKPAASPATPQASAAPAPLATAACPKGIALFANAWRFESMPTNIRTKAEELVATATKRDTRNAGNAEASKGDESSRPL